MLNGENFLWVEKYRPAKVADTVLPYELKTVFQQFVDQNNVPNLILSGGPGVGKTTIAVNLALTQAIKEKCLLLDADMGMANAHILLGVNPEVTVREVIEGKSSLEQAIVKAPNELNFLSGGSGITELLSIDSKKNLILLEALIVYLTLSLIL